MPDDLEVVAGLAKRLGVEIPPDATDKPGVPTYGPGGPSYMLDDDRNVIGLNLSRWVDDQSQYAAILSEVPAEIFELPHLRNLDLRGNNLRTLPERLFDLGMDVTVMWERDGTITVDDNPLESPPLEVIDQGREAVRAYFAEITTEKTSRLFEAKLLIVGQGGVGKTCLMQRLVRDEVDPATASTEGIDIERWDFTISPTVSLRTNIWDFGGQEIYHSTHQFFLTKRSLYILVWEARTDADLLSFDYWLNTIRVLGGDSPVVVVQNKVDERQKYINEEGWRERFPNIAAYHEVSAIENIGIDGLRKAIVRNVQALPHIGDVLPSRWLDIRQELEERQDAFISYSEYLELCERFGMDDVQAARLSEYFHDLGVLLHFRKNLILRNTIFLEPEWATRAVYRLIDDDSVKNASGRFTFSDLARIWTAKREFPLEKHMELVELMKSFELCFELPEGETYIIPELLRANQPQAVAVWDRGGGLRFRFVYAFMPSGIMTRFIVRTHDLIKEDTYWKDGVILTYEGADALVVKTDGRTIDVWVRGAEGKTLLGIVRRDLARTNEAYTNLTVAEMVPCVCATCAAGSDPTFYAYDVLMRARQHTQHMQCQQSFESVAIADVLAGVESATTRRDAQTKRIKVFLASAAELKAERDQIELLIGQTNRRLFEHGVFVDLVLWEDQVQSFRRTRVQDGFNEKMLECEVVICMFFTKVGRFSKEEFELAYESLRLGKKPYYLFVYFKDTKVRINEIDEEVLDIRRLREEIEGAEQIYCQFESMEGLVRQVKEQLDLVVAELAA